MAEALFQRASCYARLVTYFGNVVYVTEVIDIDAAFQMGQTPKEEVIPLIYADYDEAIKYLPEKYSGTSSQRATKGAAMAMKARLHCTWAIGKFAGMLQNNVWTWVFISCILVMLIFS